MGNISVCIYIVYRVTEGPHLADISVFLWVIHIYVYSVSRPDKIWCLKTLVGNCPHFSRHPITQQNNVDICHLQQMHILLAI